LKLVNSDPPSVSSVDTDENGNVVVTGSNFASDSQVYFDGLPAATSVATAPMHRHPAARHERPNSRRHGV